MTDSGPTAGRSPSSAAFHAAPSSPRPSVRSRASRSSLHRTEAIPATASSTTATSPPQIQELSASRLDPQEPQPAFGPFFPLLISTAHPSQRHTLHHPSVHYIFADDDPEILTAALASHQQPREGGFQDSDNPEDEEGEAGAQDAARTRRERAIILDLTPHTSSLGTFDVSWVSSLAPDWAVIGARVVRMVPEAESASAVLLRQQDPQQQTQDGGGPLMLRIEGVTVEPSSNAPSLSPSDTGAGSQSSGGGSGNLGAGAAGKAQSREDYSAFIDDFERRMTVLRRVVDAAENRRATLAEAEAASGAAEAEEDQQAARRALSGQDEETGSDDETVTEAKQPTR